MKQAKVPGLSVALIRHSAIVWEKGFGVRSPETGAPVEPNTIFEAASLGKPVFAYAVMKLVEQKKLNLDTPLANYFPLPDLQDPRAEQITARMVLSHRTGLPNWRRSQPLRIYFTPGERFSYSGEGFAYLQKVVEHITGERADQFVEETVFKPLGMQNSSYVWQTRFEEQTAMPYGPSGAVTQKRKPTTPNVASTLQTTAPDYARFVVAILTGEGLKKETLHKMLSAQVKVDPNCVMCTDKPAGQLSETLAWGLGWGLEETKAGRAIWHWGDNDNFKGYVIAYPEQQTGAVYFANSFNGLALRDKLIEEAVGGKHPAFAWAKYDQFDSPKARIQEALEKAFADQGDDAGLSLYEKLRAEHPAEFKDETLLGNLGFALMNRKKPKEAAVVFELNAKAFPNSWMVYDSLGLIYMVQGRKEMAIRNYKKSLELNPANQRAQDTIKMLESQPGR